jgi:hypothetical protein
LIPWEGIGCHRIGDFDSDIRISEMSLDNNYFTGPMSNFTSLTMLERFYSGNPYLLMGKRECILHNLGKNYKNKIGFKVAIEIGGLIALAVLVISLLSIGYLFDCGQRKVYKEEETIMVPIPTKSRAFTRNEMITATQSFSREIGRGGFGSVFFGKLPEGQLMAVKVLSLFYRQGIKEFLNEVDLLSKINHRNLLSLLGYCNETKEVILIYKHMSGGSLRDHLHGKLYCWKICLFQSIE